MELINIISQTFNKQGVGGPHKVIENTIKGFRKAGIEYVVNQDIRDYKHNWIHDSSKSLLDAAFYKLPVVLGPNIVVLPKDLPGLRPKLTNSIYLVPSNWSKEVWKVSGFTECPIYSWPVGIDVDAFNLNRSMAKNHNNVMIYFKRRDEKLLEGTKEILKRKGLNPIVIKCGSYTEDQYKEVLAKCIFGIWIGISESQGIALQEALASNLPLIVNDCRSLFEKNADMSYKFPPELSSIISTSAPYFDETCGIVIQDNSKIESSIEELILNLDFYKPREFIQKNLSLEKQAFELVSLFEYIGLKLNSSTDLINHVKRKSVSSFLFWLLSGASYSIFIFKRKVKTFLRILCQRIK